MSPLSIRTYLLLLVLALSVPLTAVIAYDIYRETQQVIAHTKTKLRTLATMMVSNTGDKIANARQVLERLAERPLVKKLDHRNCDTGLKDVHALSPDYSNIVYTDLEGQTLCSTVPLPGDTPVNVGNEPWFQELLKEKRFTIGRPHHGPITGKWVSVLSAPIWNEGQEMIGAIHMPLDLAAFDPKIPTQFLPAESRYGFFAEDGTMIWRNLDPEAGIGTPPPAEAAHRIVAMRDGEFESLAIDGVTRFVSVMSMPETGWVAFVGVPVATIYAEARQRATSQAILALTMIGALVLLGISIARRITRPVATLERTARAVHCGDYMVRATMRGPREIVAVAREFNAMVDAHQRNDERLRAFLENSAVIAWLKTEEGRFVFVSDNFLKRFTLSREAVIGKTDHEVWPAIAADEFRRNDQKLLDEGGSIEVMEPMIEADGKRSWWLANKFIFRDSTRDRMVGGLAVDVTALKNAETELRLAASVFANSLAGIVIVDTHGGIVDVNPAFTRITGYGREEMIGKPPRSYFADEQPPEFYLAVEQSLQANGYWQGELWNRRKNGDAYAEMLAITPVRDAANQLQYYLGVFSDITQIKAHEVELDRIAHYDTLTGAPNRRLLSDRLGQAIAHAKRSGKFLAVCYLDLDGFKPINDQHGHATGDQLLIETTERLKGALRAGDTLARLGGDEFVLLLTDLAQPEESHVVLDRVLVAVSAPVRVDDVTVRVSASIGVTLYPTDNGDVDALLRHADQAMYLAKEEGKNRYRLFDPDHDRQVQVKHFHLTRLAEALKNNEFLLHYQPKVDLIDGAVVGAEALIRWRHPEQGLLFPAAFLHHMDGSNLEIAVGEWVIDSALEQISAWSAAGMPLKVSVNISADHLLRPDFPDRLRLALERHPDAAPGNLELEILETTALADMERAAHVLADCRQLGVSFALDDFGTGYSSLTYFRSLPVDVLKIDQSFVRDMLSEAGDLDLVESVVRLAQTFDRQVIAEGVETLEHGAMLIRLGCRLAQGYGIARPMPAAELPGWIIQWRDRAAWLTLGDPSPHGSTEDGAQAGL